MRGLFFRLLKRFNEKKLKAVQDLALHIGFFYLSLQQGTKESDYEKTREAIDGLGITQLNIKGNQVTITLHRPGYLIGKRGHNIDALKVYLSKHYGQEIKIKIVEDKIINWTYPYSPYDLDFI